MATNGSCFGVGYDAPSPWHSDHMEIIPALTDLPGRGQDYFELIRQKYPDISEEISRLIAFFYECFAEKTPYFTGQPFEIVSFKAFANPDHLWFKEKIFTNLFKANPKLQQEIAAIVVNCEGEWFDGFA